MNIDIDLFSVDYLRFIFSNVFTFFGFLLIIVVVKGGLSKLFEPVRKFYARVKQKYNDLSMVDSLASRVKKKLPKDLVE